MKYIKLITGFLFVIIGCLAIFSFKWFSEYFLFLSQDGAVVPHSILQLRILLISLGIVGLYLIFFDISNRRLSRLNDNLMKLSTADFLKIFLVIALILRVIAVFVFRFHLWGDWQVFDELGWHWANVGGYYIGDYPTAYRPPGYPFFLSLIYRVFGHYPQIGIAANIIFSTLIVLLSYFIVVRFWKEQIARLTLIILTFFPSQILFANKLASEPMFTALFLLSLLLFIQPKENTPKAWLYFMAGGVFLGLATLTRALTLYYLVIPAVFWFFRNRTFKKTIQNTIIAIIGFMLVVMPWMIRNYQCKGQFTIATNTGINLLIGNAPESGMGWNQAVTEKFEVNDPTQEIYIDSIATHRALHNIKENPTGFIKRGFMKVAYFYAIDTEGVWNELIEAAEHNRTDRYVIIAVFMETYYLIVLLLGMLGLLKYLFHNKSLKTPEAFLFIATIAYWTAVHFFFFGHGRYHFPIVPMISAFAAMFITTRPVSGPVNDPD